MASPFVGKWKLSDSENFDEYMKVLGVGMALRMAGKAATPEQEVTVDGDNYQFKTTTTFKTHDLKFTIGQEFDDETIDGRKVKSTVTKESDSKLVHVQQGEPSSTITREIVDGMYVMTLEAAGVKCVRKYKKTN